MKSLYKVFFAVSLVFSFSMLSVAGQCESVNNDISLSQIEEIFQKMENQAQWNTKDKLLWGYFFIDSEKAKLQKLSAQLVTDGYNQVELFFNRKNTFTLHVEKAEIHTPQTLYERGIYFSTLAIQNCIKTYDGFDVGRF